MYTLYRTNKYPALSTRVQVPPVSGTVERTDFPVTRLRSGNTEGLGPTLHGGLGVGMVICPREGVRCAPGVFDQKNL